MKGAEEQGSHGVAGRGIHQMFDHGRPLFVWLMLRLYLIFSDCQAEIW